MVKTCYMGMGWYGSCSLGHWNSRLMGGVNACFDHGTTRSVQIWAPAPGEPLLSPSQDSIPKGWPSTFTRLALYMRSAGVLPPVTPAICAMDLELGVFFVSDDWWLSFHGENARQPRKRWTNAWIIPHSSFMAGTWGSYFTRRPRLDLWHGFTSGIFAGVCRGAALRVAHGSTKVWKPATKHHGSEPMLCENLIFGWGKGGNPPAVGDVWGRGVSEMILETPQSWDFWLYFPVIGHWSRCAVLILHSKWSARGATFSSRNAPQNLTQKQSIKERQTDFCQTYQRYCLVTFKSFSSSTDCGPTG